MGQGHLQHISVGVDGFGWIVWGGLSSWEYEITTRICFTFRSSSTMMGDVEYAPALDMSKFWNELQKFDRHVERASCLAKLCNITREDRDSTDMLSVF